MKVLILEDDKYKCEALVGVIESVLPQANLTVTKSVQTGVASIQAVDFDVIILDMSLPSHDLADGGALGIPRLSGGMEILFELDYLGKESRVFIVTQYPEIEISGAMIELGEVGAFVQQKFGINVSRCIFFDYDDAAWKAELMEGIKLL